jgi:GT2 family glycosyltransferase
MASDLPHATKISVVDNSQNEIEQMKLIKEFKSQISLISNKKNLGFASGNNMGIKKALRENDQYILIINPDVEVPKRFLKPLLKAAMRANGDIVAPLIKHKAGNKNLYGLEGYVDWTRAKPSHINTSRKPIQANRTGDFVTFACVLIKSSVFKKIGLLDENFFMYLEDVDYCLRAKARGLKVVCTTAVAVKHKTSASFSNPKDKLPISFRSHMYFISKWYNPTKSTYPYLYNFFFYPYLYGLWSAQSYKRRWFT